MRLLNVDAPELELKEFFGDKIPPYAILSHTWDDDEVTFQDLQSGHYKHKAGLMKIHCTCKQAKQDGLLWCWVDTCCIDKSSSAELSEAINSMFNWYARAVVCYAYLVDISYPRTPDHGLYYQTNDDFKLSRWFSRGWTLQELIAPRCLQFYDAFWNYLGERDNELLEPVASRTGLDSSILGHPGSLRALPIARRMSWMANRKTTRIEDQAYCMLGIFGVNMPLLYGEENHAFIRLQEELIRRFHDHSLLVFSEATLTTTRRILAASPEMFAHSADLELDDTIHQTYASSPYVLTSQGLRISLPIVKIKFRSTVGSICTLDLAVLSCRINNSPIGLFLSRATPNHHRGNIFYIWSTFQSIPVHEYGLEPVADADTSCSRNLVLVPEEIAITARSEELLIVEDGTKRPSARYIEWDRNLWFRHDMELEYVSSSPGYISENTVAKLQRRLSPHMIQLKGFFADDYTVCMIKFRPLLVPDVAIVAIVRNALAYGLYSQAIRAKLAVVESHVEADDEGLQVLAASLDKGDFVNYHASAHCIANALLCGQTKLELWYEPASSSTRNHHLLTLRFAGQDASSVGNVLHRQLSDGTVY